MTGGAIFVAAAAGIALLFLVMLIIVTRGMRDQ
jgi:heme exporter protein D